MGIIENIHSIIAVACIVILDLAAIAKAVSVIVKRARSIQAATAEEKEAAKAAVVENLRHIIFGMVTDAEKELGGGTGKLKLSKVSGWVYDKIPDDLKPLFTPEEIQTMIEAALREAQEYWNKNGKAREYIDGGIILTSEAATVQAGNIVEEIIQAVGDHIDAINKAEETASAEPQDAAETPPGNQADPGHTDATEPAQGGAGGENTAL